MNAGVDVPTIERFGALYIASARLKSMSKWRTIIAAVDIGNPLFYLIAVGIGIGVMVEQGSGTSGTNGIKYIAFIAPALLANTAITGIMDEAEQLCDRLVVMDKGSIMAEGSPASLIKQYSSKEVLEVRFGSDRNKEVAPQLATMCERMETLPDRILMYTEDGEKLLEEITHAGMHATTSLVRRSSLEDVFLRLTGRTLIE